MHKITLGPLHPRNLSVRPQSSFQSLENRQPSYGSMKLESTLSEEAGPRFGHDTIGLLDNNLLENYTRGDEKPVGSPIRVYGQVLDEDARAVPNTLIEIWQANSAGRYRHKMDGYHMPVDPNFGGCGRTITDENGAYEFLTIMPGTYPWGQLRNAWRPRHIHFSVFGHSFAQRLVTQMYFQGDPILDYDVVYNSVADKAARDRLVASLDMLTSRPMNHISYKFDIVLRGRRQSVFENKLEGM